MNTEQLKQKLSGAHLALFEQAEQFSPGEQYPAKTRESRLRELSGLLEKAQALEKPPQILTGDDTERFLKGFFADAGWRAFGRHAAETLLRICFVLLAVAVFVTVMTEKPLAEFFSVRIELAAVLAAFIGGIALTQGANLLQPASMRFQYAQNVRFTLAEILIFIGLVVAECFLVQAEPVSLPAWCVVLFALLCIPGYFIWRGFRNKKIYGTFRDLRTKLLKEADRALTDSYAERAAAEGMLKQYISALERGKVTEESFFDAMQKDEKIMAWGEAGLILVMALMVIGGTALGAKDGSERDVILLACLLVAVGYGIYQLYRRADRRARLVRRKFYAESRKRHMTLPQYLMQHIAPNADFSEPQKTEKPEQAEAEKPEEKQPETQEPEKPETPDTPAQNDAAEKPDESAEPEGSVKTEEAQAPHSA